MRIFDRPDLDQRRGELALFVTGVFDAAKPMIAYEIRLQIHNQIGAATVEQIDGGELPPGSALYVDGDEVVVTWPAYQETGAVPFANGNGNFELGDTGWSKGAGWSIEPSGGDNDGFGSYVGVFRGPGQSMIEAEAFSPTFPGQAFSAQVNVQQGASSKYNVGAGITMRFYDAAKNLIADQLGPFINDGNNGAWHLSQGPFTTPAGARYVRGAVRGARFRENKPLWVDDASWTLQATVGINYATIIDLTLRVRDSAGRSVIWAGQIKVAFVTAPSWSTEKKSVAFTISDGVTAIGAAGAAFGLDSTAVLSASPKATGKWYVEIQITEGSAGNVTFRAGLARANHPVNGVTVTDAGLGAEASSWAMLAANGECYHNGNFSFFGTDDLSVDSPSDRFGIAYDASSGRMWFRKVGVGAWRGGGDPATDSTPTFIGESGLHFAASLSSLSGSPLGTFVIAESGDAATPVGFTYWTD